MPGVAADLAAGAAAAGAGVAETVEATCFLAEAFLLAPEALEVFLDGGAIIMSLFMLEVEL